MGEKARASVGLRGLLPPRVTEPSVEVARALAAVRAAGGGLRGYSTLMAIRAASTRVFYSLLQQNIEELLPILYTPTVGDACLQWGTLYPRPPGLYICATDRGRVAEVLQAWPYPQPRIAVVTDGERILGLGDLGAHGMGIPVGKSTVYSGCGVPPQWLVPLTVDAGCDTDAVREDPLYMGLPRKRLRGPKYWELMGEVVFAMQKVWGRRLVVHWEDVGARSAYRLLRELRTSGVPTFNDDIECTAAAVVAALLASARVPGVPPLRSQTFLFFGAGQANIGTARLLVRALQAQGRVSEAAAKEAIWMVDSKGPVTSDRGDLSAEKNEFARQPFRSGKNLEDIVAALQPTCLIGAAPVGGVFTEAVITTLTQGVQAQAGRTARPVVLALSNPTSKAECTFEDAYRWSGGSVVFASGTRFPGVEVEPGRVVEGSQVNNCYVFPGIGLGAVVAGGPQVTGGTLLAAASALAGCVSGADIAEGRVMPPLKDLPSITRTVAAAVAAAAYDPMAPSNTPPEGYDISSQGGGAVAAAQGAGGRRTWADLVASVVYDPFSTWQVGE